jgi:hypothetical protein
MTQRIVRAYDVPLTPAALVERLRSRDVVEQRGQGGGLTTALLVHEPTPDGVRIVVRTEIPVDWLPAVVRGRLGTDPAVERTEAWAVDGDGAQAPLFFAFAGMPVTGSGSATLRPAPAGGRLEVQVDVSVDVPLVGGLVESAVAPRIGAALDAEAAFYATLGATAG